VYLLAESVGPSQLMALCVVADWAVVVVGDRCRRSASIIRINSGAMRRDVRKP